MKNDTVSKKSKNVKLNPIDEKRQVIYYIVYKVKSSEEQP